MTIDSTLKIKRGGGKLRNVLKRHERLAKMQEDGRWKDESSTVLGMPKVRVLKLSLKKKKKVKTEGDAATPAAGGKAGGKAVPAAKGAAAPAAGKAAAKPAGKK